MCDYCVLLFVGQELRTTASLVIPVQNRIPQVNRKLSAFAVTRLYSLDKPNWSRLTWAARSVMEA